MSRKNLSKTLTGCKQFTTREFQCPENLSIMTRKQGKFLQERGKNICGKVNKDLVRSRIRREE